MPLARAAALVPAALGILLFAGCAAQPLAAEKSAPATATPEPTTEAVAEQSVADACAVLVEGAQGFMAFSSMSESMAAAMEDPEGTVAQLETAGEAFSLAVQQVSNAEVQPVALEADVTMQAYIVYLRGIIADPADVDVNALGPQVDALTSSFTAIGQVCA